MQTLLGGLLKNRQLVSSMRRVMVMTLWDQVVGEVLSRKSWPEKMAADGVLTVGVKDHSWAEELRLHKVQIISRYHLLLGNSALNDVNFRVSKRKSRLPIMEEKKSIILHPTPADPLPSLSEPDEMLREVTNPEVRDLLTPRFARLNAERKWKEAHGWARCDDCERIFHGATCPHCGGHPKVA